MSRFKVGQTVYMGRDKTLITLIVKRVIKNPLLPIRQYGFEAPNDGFICGEQSIRKSINGKDLRVRDCFID